jgi:PTH1 family peptidyl-tRNA hydrolase
MKLIVGLGNPGKEYDGTRHNVGFQAIDLLAGRCEGSRSSKFEAELFKGRLDGHDVLLMKPQTYMNLSGEAVSQAANFYKIDVRADLIVIHDDLDLPPGAVRMQRDISSAGHNGVKSIIERLGHQEFTRIRIGIGRPTDPTPIDDYVLHRFSPDEAALVAPAIGKACQFAEEALKKS